MTFILQVSELPSIDLVRIIDGKVEGTSIDYLDSEQGHRAMGFMTLLEKFQDKVRIPSLLCSFLLFIMAYVAPRHAICHQFEGGGQGLGTLGTPPIS